MSCQINLLETKAIKTHPKKLVKKNVKKKKRFVLEREHELEEKRKLEEERARQEVIKAKASLYCVQSK